MATTKEQRQKWGLYPSRDVDVETALKLLDWSWYRFARSTEKLDTAMARAVIEAIPAWAETPANTPHRADHRRSAAHFITTSVEVAGDDETFTAQWRTCVNALKGFESQYAWGSEKKTSQLRAIAGDQRLLEGARAAAVACPLVPTEMLAVLVIDGTPESADALIPHVHRAMKTVDRLQALEHLLRFAESSTMKELLAVVERKLASERENSPVLALARRLGLTTSARFRVALTAKGTNDLALQLDLDSARPGAPFRGWLHAGGRERWLRRDDGTTVCSLDELPRFLAQMADEQRSEWQWDSAKAYPLKGKRHAAFMTWVRGGA